MTNHTADSRDEIELFDYLRVISKWKYLIALGTLLFSLSAAVVSFKMAEVYTVDMILTPGIVRLGEGGEHKYIDSMENIRSLIETGTFDEKILSSLINKDGENLPKNLYFHTEVPAKSNTLKISYETSHIDQGIRILTSLHKLVVNRYSNLIDFYKSEHQIDINIKLTEISNFKASAKYSKEKIKNIQKRIDELKSETDLINSKIQIMYYHLFFILTQYSKISCLQIRIKTRLTQRILGKKMREQL
jgi:hypothetical protein